MSTIRTGYWIRVENGEVKDVWDSAPADTAGWTTGVEVLPDLTPNREIITTHQFDLTKNPIEIIWGKRDLLVDERKSSLIGQAQAQFQQVVQQQMMLQMSANPAEEFDTTIVTTAKTVMQARIDAINAAVTHEDIDALME
jgi:hypothetical protein